MQSLAATPEAYIEALPPDRKASFSQLYFAIKKNLPKGFKEGMYSGMIGFVVPHSMYPAGYHTNPKVPLPFISLANQKNFIAVYHMGIYVDPKLLLWFMTEFFKCSKYKLDMGKSCIRFKRPDAIPLELMGKLAGKITPKEWIRMYKKELKR